MNIVLDNAIDATDPNREIDIGKAVIRGNTIVLWEILDRVI
ncbi:UNVERIFIED_CONTAM: hypothetical protein GTU68_045868 [Idotea baltica]|nr:hypothetical protein [Idotea baltica]